MSAGAGTHPAPFELTGPLPTGVLAIEASAGTGKTYTLAGLATRFVAEGRVSAPELLVVTFTRAATAELRSRVRRQLVDAADHLRSDGPPPEEPLLRHLVDVTELERAERLARVQRAVTEFDAATVTTIHGFATQVLGTLGVTAGTDPDAGLVDDDARLVDEVCADLLAAAAVAGHPAEHLPRHPDLVHASAICLATPDLQVVPAPGEPGCAPEHLLLAELVRDSVDAVRRRRRQAGTLSFDDVLLELQQALQGPGGDAVIDSLRNRFRVALIDEFQDTDPVQWDIFSTLFGDGAPDTTLVLVGDPKQAIYSFRGANVWTYTDAVRPRPGLERRALTTNWRSDGAMVHALNTLFAGATFGDAGIAYTAVHASPDHDPLRLTDRHGTVLPSLSIRLALGADLERIERYRARPVRTEAARRAIYADLAGQVRRLLDSAVLPARAGAAARPLRPSDVAVLIRTATEAADVQAALQAEGVPAVLARAGSVLDSEAATQWRWLLDALLHPSDPARARLFALSWFGGLDPARIASLDDDALAGLQEQLHSLAEVLAGQGVQAFVQRVWAVTGVSSRVLTRPTGERDLTDLEHVAELLVAAHPDGPTSAAGLLAALDEPSHPGDAGTDTDLLTRRVESEQQAVQVMTIWVAKGLEFPVVCCPTLWASRSGATIFRDPDTGARTFDVTGGGPWPDTRAGETRRRLARAEATGEDLRLAYVALTRARHHTIVWWTRTRDSAASAAARLLFARTDGGLDEAAFGAGTVTLPADEDALDALEPLVRDGDGTIEVALHGRPARSPAPWVDPAASPPAGALAVAHLGRTPDRSAHRWSFTAITGRAPLTHLDPDGPWADLGSVDPGDVDHPVAGGADERSPDPATDPELDDTAASRPVGVAPGAGPGADPGAGSGSGAAQLTLDDARTAPLALLPAGAELGTLVHAVLERADFAAAELDTDLGALVDGELSWRVLDLRPDGVAGATAADGRVLLTTGLRAALETPLGARLGDVSLRRITRRDRIDEMPFELRLAGSGAAVTEREIGRLVLDHLPDTDPLRDWAGALAEGLFDAYLAGHLTGSIDAVLRLSDGDGGARFVVVDYKTNRLQARGRLPAPGDYGRPALARAMAEHHYPLQALLYCVALHRYLRWRLPGYRPEVHLGGVAYLFVRGMVGGHTPVRDGHPDGVFDWDLPPSLVVALSALLDGSSPGGSR